MRDTPAAVLEPEHPRHADLPDNDIAAVRCAASDALYLDRAGEVGTDKFRDSLAPFIAALAILGSRPIKPRTDLRPAPLGTAKRAENRNIFTVRPQSLERPGVA